jgi:hypothetical protein
MKIIGVAPCLAFAFCLVASGGAVRAQSGITGKLLLIKNSSSGHKLTFKSKDVLDPIPGDPRLGGASLRIVGSNGDVTIPLQLSIGIRSQPPKAISTAILPGRHARS